MRQISKETQSPPDRCGNEFLGWVHRLSPYWFGEGMSRCLLVSTLGGDVRLMFLGTVENHMGMEPLAIPAPSPNLAAGIASGSMLHAHLADGTASDAVGGLGITQIAA